MALVLAANAVPLAITLDSTALVIVAPPAALKSNTL